MSPRNDAYALSLGALLLPLVLFGCHSDAPDFTQSNNFSRTASAVTPPPPPQPSIEPPGSRAGAPLPTSDGTLVAMVESALLAEPEMHSSDIDVSAVEGTVYLRGKAKNRDTRRMATQIATTVDGVKRVENELFVTGGS